MLDEIQLSEFANHLFDDPRTAQKATVICKALLVAAQQMSVVLRQRGVEGGVLEAALALLEEIPLEGKVVSVDAGLLQRQHVSVMLALGVWPESGCSLVIGCEIGDGPSEDQESWLHLLTRLEARGLRPECGLQLFVHEGVVPLLPCWRKCFLCEKGYRQCLLRNSSWHEFPPGKIHCRTHHVL